MLFDSAQGVNPATSALAADGKAKMRKLIMIEIQFFTKIVSITCLYNITHVSI